ncbi:hypothetical protein [Methylobacterium bullatum]|uniref:Uncharacterized protein n=1 Tax=Methylobacterium bullatum TaxID=570505 RepID=A0A679KJN9_9HYPH|nr:hypothetical protein MBLL_04719 [Methylobacterium bullatum]
MSTMPSLDGARFAKVRALHDSTTSPGEKTAAASRMEALAKSAGMTVKQAKSKLDKAARSAKSGGSKTQAQATADAFNDFFNRPEQRAETARRHAEQQIQRAQILAEFGSIEAVYAETDREAALREACKPITIPDLRPGWEDDYTLDGWKLLDSDVSIPTSVLDAVRRGWPMPTTVKEAWAEYEASKALDRKRQTMHDYEHWPELWVMVRDHLLRTALATLPAASIGDMLARQSWMEADLELRVINETVLATLRADVERMAARIPRSGGETA